MQKRVIIIFILICLPIVAVYKAHSFYLKDVQQELNAQQTENKKKWSRILKDMLAEEVRDILGKPERIAENVTIVWFYQKGGSVEFLNGKVIKSTKPYSWDYKAR